jgi:hypothetical protein
MEFADRRNGLLEGAVHQGLKFLQLSAGLQVRAFGQLNFSWDRKDLDYNNKIRPALGAQLEFSPFDGSFVEIGVKYEWDRREITDRTLSGAVRFVSWSAWRAWEVVNSRDSAALRPRGYLFSTWGQVRYPGGLEPFELKNALLEGFIDVSADWWRGAQGLVLNSFLLTNYKMDRRRLDWNNEVKPGLGLRIRFFRSNTSRVEIGTMIMYQYRFRSSRAQVGAMAFLNWSSSW